MKIYRRLQNRLDNWNNRHKVKDIKLAFSTISSMTLIKDRKTAEWKMKIFFNKKLAGCEPRKNGTRRKCSHNCKLLNYWS